MTALRAAPALLSPLGATFIMNLPVAVLLPLLNPYPRISYDSSAWNPKPVLPLESLDIPLESTEAFLGALEDLCPESPL